MKASANTFFSSLTAVEVNLNWRARVSSSISCDSRFTPSFWIWRWPHQGTPFMDYSCSNQFHFPETNENFLWPSWWLQCFTSSIHGLVTIDDCPHVPCLVRVRSILETPVLLRSSTLGISMLGSRLQLSSTVSSLPQGHQSCKYTYILNLGFLPINCHTYLQC